MQGSRASINIDSITPYDSRRSGCHFCRGRSINRKSALMNLRASLLAVSPWVSPVDREEKKSSESNESLLSHDVYRWDSFLLSIGHISLGTRVLQFVWLMTHEYRNDLRELQVNEGNFHTDERITHWAAGSTLSSLLHSAWVDATWASLSALTIGCRSRLTRDFLLRRKNEWMVFFSYYGRRSRDKSCRATRDGGHLCCRRRTLFPETSNKWNRND